MADIAKKFKLSSLEKPKDIYLTKEPFGIENGLLTATMKLKRNEATKAYKTQIDQMYANLK